MLHRYEADISGIEPPSAINDPFAYEPHPLVRLAAAQVMPWLKGVKAAEEGKMLGVLAVSDNYGGIGFLAAFSGDMACAADIARRFVPPVIDLDDDAGFYARLDAEVMSLNRLIEAAESAPAITTARERLSSMLSAADEKLGIMKRANAAAKARRNEMRLSADADTSALIRESQFQKAELKRLRRQLTTPIEQLRATIARYDRRLEELRRLRRDMSEAVQREIFSRTEMLNARGERRSLLDIFDGVPPSGTGSCAAPKLLQYAFANRLTPLAMGEFWYGKNVTDTDGVTLRREGCFYPSCESRCRPILTYMLRDI